MKWPKFWQRKALGLVFGCFLLSGCSGETDSDNLRVLSRVHFNTNVSNFDAAKAFYLQLGMETLSDFPDTNTLEMAQAIGIRTPTSYDGSQGEAAGGYLLHGELLGFGFSGGVIDLIEFTIPRNEDPPYAKLNRLGMVKAAMLTTNLDADYRYLTELAVKFLSAPATRSDGSRFAIFKDLDGTFYELLEIEGEDQDSEPPHIQRLGAVTINVSNYERSAAWYKRLGFQLTQRIDAAEKGLVAKAMGFDEPIAYKGGVFTHAKDGSQLEIVEWISPRDLTPPYPIPINHIGIHRIAFSTSDIEGDVEKLRGQGVEFISDITPCCSGPDSWGGIVAFYDPDGTIVELVEQPIMTLMGTVSSWFN